MLKETGRERAAAVPESETTRWVLAAWQRSSEEGRAALREAHWGKPTRLRRFDELGNPIRCAGPPERNTACRAVSHPMG